MPCRMTATLADLSSRLDAVLQRLAALELAAGLTPFDALEHRQLAILRRLEMLEVAAGVAAPSSAAAAPAALLPASRPLPSSASATLLPEVAAVDRSGNEVQQRLQAELLERGLNRHKFVRVRDGEALASDGRVQHGGMRAEAAHRGTPQRRISCQRGSCSRAPAVGRLSSQSPSPSASFRWL